MHFFSFSKGRPKEWKQLNKPYQNDKYSIHYEAQRKAIRSVNITYEDSYEYTLKIGENK